MDWERNDRILTGLLSDIENAGPAHLAALGNAAAALTLARLELRGQIDFERQQEEQRVAFEETAKRHREHERSVRRSLGEEL